MPSPCSNGWSASWSPSAIADQTEVAFYVFAWDQAGNGAGSPLWFTVALVSTTVFAVAVTRLAGRTFDADRQVLRIA